MKILFKYPSRSRPERFFEGLQNLVDNIHDKNNYHISCTLDIDDESMNNESIINKILSYPNTSIAWGRSESKVHAVNRDLPNYGDIICVMSDDMRFKTFGFDDIIRKHMPSSLDALVHFPDDYAKEKVCTVAIIGRKYYERDGFIYQPNCYYSMFCDDEQTDVSKIRGCYIFIPDAMEIDHLHYTNMGKAGKDALYRRNDTYLADKRIYEERKARNFDL